MLLGDFFEVLDLNFILDVLLNLVRDLKILIAFLSMGDKASIELGLMGVLGLVDLLINLGLILTGDDFNGVVTVSVSLVLKISMDSFEVFDELLGEFERGAGSSASWELGMGEELGLVRLWEEADWAILECFGIAPEARLDVGEALNLSIEVEDLLLK